MAAYSFFLNFLIKSHNVGYLSFVLFQEHQNISEIVSSVPGATSFLYKLLLVKILDRLKRAKNRWQRSNLTEPYRIKILTHKKVLCSIQNGLNFRPMTILLLRNIAAARHTLTNGNAIL